MSENEGNGGPAQHHLPVAPAGFAAVGGRAIEIIYSMGLLAVRVMAMRASAPSRTTVNISSGPSRSDAAALK